MTRYRIDVIPWTLWLLLVLSDTQIPNVSGFQVFRRLYASRYRVEHDNESLMHLFRDEQQPSHRKEKDQHDRRCVLQNLFILTSAITLPQEAVAGEIGEKITEAVTRSELGVAVRKSVVRGSQVMDGIDGKWEQLSDRFKLGSERSKRPGRPSPKVIPPPKPMDIQFARSVLEMSDAVFVRITGISAYDLVRQVDKVATIVRPSFARSGDLGDVGDLFDLENNAPASGIQLNYESYVRFKAYADLCIERKVDFPRFKKEFEKELGKELVGLFLGRGSMADMPKDMNADQRREALRRAVAQVERLCDILVQRGFVAQIDSANPFVNDPEQVIDWSEDLFDLSWSIALDGDVTLGSQILLQEQGFRLYPNFARMAIQTILDTIPGQQVSIDDYYMDTDYNSDPEKFEAKEVLVNIVLEHI